jgi:hypothetical protein
LGRRVKSVMILTMNFALSSPGMPLIPGKSRSMKRNHFDFRYAILILIISFVSGSAIAQKVNPDTLSQDQLNLNKDKAVRMRNSGIILTSCGVATVAASFIVGVLIGEVPADEQDGTWGDYTVSLYVIGIGGMAGIATALVGVPLWLTGDSRMAKAELSLQKLIMVPENSMALGLGITIKF